MRTHLVEDAELLPRLSGDLLPSALHVCAEGLFDGCGTENNHTEGGVNPTAVKPRRRRRVGALERLVSVPRPLLETCGLVSEALIPGPCSVSDWAHSGILIKTGRDSAITAMTRSLHKRIQLLLCYAVWDTRTCDTHFVGPPHPESHAEL